MVTLLSVQYTLIFKWVFAEIL